ncbi:MAG: S-methyl-5-thioribose-1-phosphate isomerase [Candidatus Diapherotrites archaeon]
MPDKNLLKTVKEIKSLKIQGASQVRRATILAIKSIAEKSKAKNVEEFRRELKKAMQLLANARPTEPETRNALTVLLKTSMKNLPLSELKREIARECDEFEEKRKKAMRRIAELGAEKLRHCPKIFTHCHSHTVEGILLEMHKRKSLEHVFLTETRPKFQGRITARNLARAGVPCTMIVDSAARSFIGKCDAFLTGADAIIANGAVINKIGTSQISLAAKKAGVPHYVATNSQAFDAATFFGAEEKIEERSKREVWSERLPKLEIRNPAFDITEPELVKAIICEKGVFPPDKFVRQMVREAALEGKKFVSLIEMLR